MYQHDLSSSVLNERLTEVIQECVNSGGVDVNTASAHLLQYVAGLNASRARAIVDHRMARGAFQSVSEVRSVKGIGDISFQNAAGFLRVFGGINPLDTTAVHPEHYELLLRLLGWADAKMATVTAVADDSNSVKSGTTKAKGKPKSRSFELVDASEIGSDRVKAICAFIINHQDEIPEEILSGVERNLDQGFTKLRKSVDETGGRGASKRKLAIDAIEDSNNNPTTKAKKIKTDVDVVSTSSMSQSNHNRDTAVSDCGEASEPKVSSLRSAALHTVTKWMDWMSRPISNAVHSSRSSSGVPRSANTGWISEDMRAGNPPTLIRFDATTREVVGRIGIIGQGSEPLGELIGRSFEGVVKNIVPFGVFVDIGASNSGLLHKSQFDAVGKSNHDGSRVGALKLRLSDIVIGQRIRVKVTGIKPVDRIELSLDI
jgi:competence ComEA-like helix-hairpin-helix protein